MMSTTVASIAELVGGEVHGDGGIEINGIGDLASAGPGDIGFVRGTRNLAEAEHTRAGALLVPELLTTGAAQIVVRDPFLAFAQVAQHFHPVPRATDRSVHPSAVVDPSAQLGTVEIGPMAVIGAGAKIGAGTVIGAGAVVGEGCIVGDDCLLHPRATLYPRVELGARVIVHAGAVIGSDGFGFAPDERIRWTKVPQIGGVVVEDDVEIGANTTIDCGTLTPTRIGRGTKIDNLVHIGHNCTLGEDDIMAGLCGLAGHTELGDRVHLAGHVVTSGHLTVPSNTRLGGASVVHGSVTEKGEYIGYPLQDKKRWARTKWILDHLVELHARVRDLSRRAD